MESEEKRIDETQTTDDDEVKDSYTRLVVEPLVDLMLERSFVHVENRLLATAEQEDGQPPSWGIRHFIDRRDWSSLSKCLADDRDLYWNLWDHRDYLPPELFDDARPDPFVNGLDKLKRKYFTGDFTRKTFTLSKYAVDLSRPPSSPKATEPKLGQQIGAGKQALWTNVKGITDSIKRLLGEPLHPGRHATDQEKRYGEESDPLIDEVPEKGEKGP